MQDLKKKMWVMVRCTYKKKNNFSLHLRFAFVPWEARLVYGALQEEADGEESVRNRYRKGKRVGWDTLL